MSSRLAVDWRDAWRAFRATPVVTLMAVLSLALGIGANTALFSILNSLVLRTLPVRASAVLFGRTAADLVRIAMTAAVAAATGVIAGWRVHSGPAAAVAGFLLVLTFGYAVTWLSVVVGLSVHGPGAARVLVPVCLIPLTFVSNVLVAALIVYLGDQLGVGGQLSTGVVVVLGVRIFGNAAAIRRHLFRA